MLKSGSHFKNNENSMSVSVIFGNLNAIVKIGEYLNIVDSVNNKVGRLISMHLSAANYALESATRTTNESEYIKYIERARNKFIDAISVESNDVNLIQAYFGLAFCNHLVTDDTNMVENLKKAKSSYDRLWNRLPDKDSLLQQMSEEGSGEGGAMEKTIISIVSLGAIPLVSSITEMVKKTLRNKIMKEIGSVGKIMEEIEKKL